VNNCSAVLTGPKLAPGGARQTGVVVVKKSGSLTASKLGIYAPSCTDTKTSDGGGLTFNAPTNNPLCAATLMSIEETTASAHYCWYGVTGTAGHCQTNPGTLNDPAFASTIGAFATAYSAVGMLDLRPLGADGQPAAVGSPFTANGDPGARTFEIALYLPNSASNQNALQGLQSTFGLTWHIDQ
jgi:hypothetical protein